MIGPKVLVPKQSYYTFEDIAKNELENTFHKSIGYARISYSFNYYNSCNNLGLVYKCVQIKYLKYHIIKKKSKGSEFFTKNLKIKLLIF